MFTISWPDKGAATYGVLSACILVRVWGLDVGVRVGRQRSLQLTKIVILWVVIHRRKTDLRIHVSGLSSTLEKQGPLAFISQVMLVKTHMQSIIPGHPRKWNETEENTAISTLFRLCFYPGHYTWISISCLSSLASLVSVNTAQTKFSKRKSKNRIFRWEQHSFVRS